MSSARSMKYYKWKKKKSYKKRWKESHHKLSHGQKLKEEEIFFLFQISNIQRSSIISVIIKLPIWSSEILNDFYIELALGEFWQKIRLSITWHVGKCKILNVNIKINSQYFCGQSWRKGTSVLLYTRQVVSSIPTRGN